MCVDYTVEGGVAFLDDHFKLILWANLLGIILCVVSLLGWAKHSDRRGRLTIGAVTFLLSAGIAIFGNLIRPSDVHGPFSLLFLTLLPTSALGLALWLFAMRSGVH
jgi:drug/metabolite transporter (DMT)-like permease